MVQYRCRYLRSESDVKRLLVHKAYKFRLYPTADQTTLINKSIGCSRYIYNHFLSAWNELYQETGKGLTYKTCSAQLTQIKQVLVWLKEPDKFSLQNALRNLSDAYQRFFNK